MKNLQYIFGYAKSWSLDSIPDFLVYQVQTQLNLDFPQGIRTKICLFIYNYAVISKNRFVLPKIPDIWKLFSSKI